MSKQSNNRAIARPRNIDSCDVIVAHLLKNIDPSTLRAAKIAAAYKGKPVEEYIADALFKILCDTAENVLAEVVQGDIIDICDEYALMSDRKAVAS